MRRETMEAQAGQRRQFGQVENEVDLTRFRGVIEGKDMSGLGENFLTQLLAG